MTGHDDDPNPFGCLAIILVVLAAWGVVLAAAYIVIEVIT